MKAIADRTNNYQIFSGSTLKLIAVITMFIDHAAIILLSDVAWATESFSVLGKSITVYWLLRKVGRLAFPIFCFLITEGFLHTRNPKRYALSLLVFALVSEVPFDLMAGGRWFYLGKQNVYFTLLLGVILLWTLKNIKSTLQQIGIFVGLFVLAQLLAPDYGFTGVLLIGILYVLRDQKVLQTLFAFPMLSGGVAALCAFVPIHLYNGKRGFIQGKFWKYAFYAFYPLHIVLLLLIKRC